MLIAQPNASFLWVQYMSFHLKNAEIETARAIAERALRTIVFREEEEKQNIWVCWLNMEHKV
jgi:rRNA biogenesis protein RRP5